MEIVHGNKAFRRILQVLVLIWLWDRLMNIFIYRIDILYIMYKEKIFYPLPWPYIEW